MNLTLLDCLESLLSRLREAGAMWGIPSENILRTYSPEGFVTTMEENRPYLVLYLQDCDLDEETVQAGIMRKIALRIAVLSKIPSLTNEWMDPMLNIFERVQNWLIQFLQWKSERQYYTITKKETAEVVNAEALDRLVFLCAVDLDVETLVPYGG